MAPCGLFRYEDTPGDGIEFGVHDPDNHAAAVPARLGFTEQAPEGADAAEALRVWRLTRRRAQAPAAAGARSRAPVTPPR